MIPNIELLTDEITEDELPSYTNKADLEANRLNGYTDDLPAIEQAIYFMLSTERYMFPIYSWNYGVELVDLIGQPIPYVMSEVSRRITDCLMQDDRITNVSDFEFDSSNHNLHVTFKVETNVGSIESELEVEV